MSHPENYIKRVDTPTGVQLATKFGHYLKPSQVFGVTRLGELKVHMARLTPAIKDAPNAAWVVVGRRAYTLHHDDYDQLRLDLALCIAQMPTA